MLQGPCLCPQGFSYLVTYFLVFGGIWFWMVSAVPAKNLNRPASTEMEGRVLLGYALWKGMVMGLNRRRGVRKGERAALRWRGEPRVWREQEGSWQRKGRSGHGAGNESMRRRPLPQLAGVSDLALLLTKLILIKILLFFCQTRWMPRGKHVRWVIYM